jgi:putative endonuclease
MADDRVTLGKRGEDAACHWLATVKGYRVVARNWWCDAGEIDIVAQDGAVWVFVEVRTRRGAVDLATESITPDKRERMIRSAYAYAATVQPEPDWRIDVVAVAVRRDGVLTIEHVEDALGW